MAVNRPETRQFSDFVAESLTERLGDLHSSGRS